MLLIFQAMDAAGKDSAIKHVMSGVDPKGCQVHSFKTPSSEELDHDFLWRTSKSAAGTRAASASSTVPTTKRCWSCACTRDPCDRRSCRRSSSRSSIWRERFQDINAFERYLVAERLRHPEVLPQRLARRAAAPVDGADWIGRRRTGSSRSGIWPSGTAGGPTWRPTRKRSARRRRRMRRGSSSRPTTRNSPGPSIAAAVIDALNGLHLEFPALNADQTRDLGRARRLLKQEARRAKP